MRRVLAVLVASAALGSAQPALADKCPNMMILLDRSGSMQGYKWSAALEAISAFTSSHEAAIRFGLTVFPAPGESCGAGLYKVRCDFYASYEINLELSRMSAGGYTPTAAAVDTVGKLGDLNDGSRRRFVLLITDGDPTCPDPKNEESNLTQAVASVAALYAKGVKTFVVGFGQEVSPARLDRLAEAGGTARVGATCADPTTPGARVACKYYDASDKASLADALDQIATVAQGELGGSTCDDSCYGLGVCPLGQRCVEDIHAYPLGKTMNLGKCEADPCAGVACGPNGFCREGACHAVCTQPCQAPMICKDGQCVNDPCATDPASCACSKPCERFLVCSEGECKDDPCRSVSCPSSAPYCAGGSCYAGPALPPGSGHSEDTIEKDEPKSGCGKSGLFALWPALAVPVALAAVGRRRRR